MLRREKPPSTKPSQVDTGFRERVSTGRAGNRHTQEQREIQVGNKGRAGAGCTEVHGCTKVHGWGSVENSFLSKHACRCGLGVQPHLEVVPAVAVCVLGGVQEDEQVLTQVPGQGGKPGPAGGRQGQVQHLRGQTPWGLDELQRGKEGSQS